MDQFWINLKEKLKIYFKDAYVEMMIIDLYILITIFRRFFYTHINYILLLLISVVVFIVLIILKLIVPLNSRKVFIFNLFREIKNDNRLIPIIFINLLLCLIAFFAAANVGHITSLLVIRLIFSIEDIKIQNYILREAIEETESYEELSVFSPMVTQQTYNALMNLTRIKDQMYRAAQASVQSQQMKTELITNISHDLKTPLTSIINYSDILSKKETMDEEAKAYIHVLGRNSERLKSLIINLIDASKTGTGNVTLEPVMLNFNELVSQIYGDFDNDFKRKNLEFIYESDQEDIVIYTDGNILSRVIQNLLSNAYKYSKEGTKIFAKTHISGERIYFNIKNIAKTSLNISAEDLKSQFTRGERSRATEGSGLGLYIANNLVEILNGEFRIVIEEDYFQVFVELPIE